MITAFVGLPGSGKTYLMSKMLMDEMKKRRTVYANYPLKCARFFNDFRQVMNVRKGIIAADELHMMAPSWKRGLPMEYFTLWSQGRHMGIDFWYTTQSFHRVDVKYRTVTNYVWKCERVFYFLHRARLYDAVDVERDRRRARPIMKKWFIESKKIFRIYDTMFIIQPAEHLRTALSNNDVDPDTLPVFDADLKPVGLIDPEYDFDDDDDDDDYVDEMETYDSMEKEGACQVAASRSP